MRRNRTDHRMMLQIATNLEKQVRNKEKEVITFQEKYKIRMKVHSVFAAHIGKYVSSFPMSLPNYNCKPNHCSSSCSSVGLSFTY